MTSSSYQYVSEATYAAKRTSGQGGEGKRWSSLDVVGEALRWETGHYVEHFANRGLQPAQPIFVGGMSDPVEIQRWHDRLVSVALAPVKKRPRVETERGMEAQRSNSPVLLSLVASYPEQGLLSETEIMKLAMDERERYMRELIAKRREETLHSPAFTAWRDKTLEWAKQRYGEKRLRLAVVHYDESHIHMHVVFDDEGRSVKHLSLHAKEPPRKASTPKERKAAYQKAGTAMQDSYYVAVAQPLGIGRISPTPRQHMSNAQRQAMKTREIAQAAADEMMRQVHVESRRLSEAAKVEAQTIERNAQERARRDIADAHAKAEADLARIKAAQLEEMATLRREAQEDAARIRQAAKAEVAIQREEMLAKLRAEMDELGRTERARVVAETKAEIGKQIDRLYARDESWEMLIEYAVPNKAARLRMRKAFGLGGKIPRPAPKTDDSSQSA